VFEGSLKEATMAKLAPRLGKGLSALITPRETHFAPLPADQISTQGLREVAVDNIRVNPRQPRKNFDTPGIEQLAQSIRSSGMLQPVLLRPVEDGQFELVAGERRWRAARLANLERVPAIVRSVSDAESLELALIENLQREDLNPLERAGAYQQYIHTFGVTSEELARRLGESRANVANYLRLLNLCDEIKRMLETGQLGMGQARAIAGIEDPQRQLAVARMTARRNLAVRQVEALARSTPAGKASVESMPASSLPRESSRHINEVAEALSRALGLPVVLVPGKRKNSGRIVIRYRNLEEFDLIAEKLGGRPTLE
jgi:ParB family chromosome partitioning protein